MRFLRFLYSFLVHRKLAAPLYGVSSGGINLVATSGVLNAALAAARPVKARLAREEAEREAAALAEATATEASEATAQNCSARAACN